MGFSWVVCFQLSEWRRNMRRCHPPACLARCHHRHQPSATATWPEIQKAPNPHISPWFAFLYIIILSYHGENMQSWGIPHILGKSRAAGNSWPEKPSNQRPGSEWVVNALADTWPIHVGEALGSFRMVRGLDPRMKIGLEMMNFQKICGWCMDYDYEIPGRLLYNYIYILYLYMGCFVFLGSCQWKPQFMGAFWCLWSSGCRCHAHLRRTRRSCVAWKMLELVRLVTMSVSDRHRRVW